LAIITAVTEFGIVIPRLPVVDLTRTLDFYIRQLGFAVDVAWPAAAPTFVILRRGHTRVGFFVPNEHHGPLGYAELYVQVSGIQELHATLARDVPVEWGPEVYSYGRREFAVRDPNQYLLIFTEATTDPATTPEPDPE
jgi:catechol 2,3-dioxygenase-like lactoylglutathione lyase family enzyme